MMEAHSMDAGKVLRLAAAMGSPPARVILIGCEPAVLPADDELLDDMSVPVKTAVDHAVKLVTRLVDRVLDCGGADFISALDRVCAGDSGMETWISCRLASVYSWLRRNNVNEVVRAKHGNLFNHECTT